MHPFAVDVFILAACTEAAGWEGSEVNGTQGLGINIFPAIRLPKFNRRRTIALRNSRLELPRLGVQEVAAGELEENLIGVIAGLFICPGVPPARASESFEEGDSRPAPPVCFRRVCEKRRRDVWDRPPPLPLPCSRSLELEPICARVGACLMKTEAGQLLCCCRSFPPCAACALAKFFTASALAPDLSQTCQQLQEGFYFIFFMNSPIAIFHELHIKPAWRNAL